MEFMNKKKPGMPEGFEPIRSAKDKRANGKRMEWNAESGRYNYFDAKTGKKVEE